MMTEHERAILDARRALFFALDIELDIGDNGDTASQMRVVDRVLTHLWMEGYHVVKHDAPPTDPSEH